MGCCISMGPHKNGGIPWEYDLKKDVDIRKALDLRMTVNNMELVLKSYAVTRL